MRGEGQSLFAGHVLGFPVLVAIGISDLQAEVTGELCTQRLDTYMHVKNLAIALVAIYNGGNNHQGISRGVVPYTSLVPAAVACVCCDIEFQGPGERE